jgi:hypothetical protein
LKQLIGHQYGNGGADRFGAMDGVVGVEPLHLQSILRYLNRMLLETSDPRERGSASCWHSFSVHESVRRSIGMMNCHRSS